MKKFRLELLVALMIFSGCSKLTDAPKPNNASTGSNGSASHNQTPTIVILGSSTAAGFGASCSDSSWANKLNVAVNTNGSTHAKFINLAYGGYTTYNVLPAGDVPDGKPSADTARNITKALSYKPSLVMISLPNNDVADGFTNAEIINNYKTLTHLLDSANVSYIIFSTQPRDFTDSNQRMQLKTLNDAVKQVYTSHVNDFLDALSTADYHIKPKLEYGDGIHLDDAGHTIIYNSVLKNPILQSVIK